MPKKIIIIAYEGAQMLDLTGPMQVFSSANDELGQQYYDISLASVEGGPVQTSSGFSIVTTPLPKVVPTNIDSFIVTGGKEAAVCAASLNKNLRVWLRAAAGSTRRVCSVCTGTFVLAAAGLITGKQVATHWRGTNRLSRYYPDLMVDRDAIYVQDGTIWTSAGVTTGIDMCLAMVRADCGEELSAAIARRLVVYAHRPGSQSQFSPLVPARTDKTNPLTETLEWLERNLTHELAIKECANHAGMSERTFYRRFTKSVGVSPARYIETLRES